jgi:site-specific DNA recombinase
MMKAAIYCRVSTEDQKKEGTSLESQEEICLAKARECGYEIPEGYVFREAESGLTLTRTYLTRMRQLARSGSLSAIICLKPDRLARNGEDILLLLKEFTGNGLKLVFVKEEFDDTPTGKFLGFALGWSAEQYVIQMKEATKRGKAKAIAAGRLPQGCGAGLYGFNWDKAAKKRVIHPFEAKIVKKMWEDAANRVSLNHIAIVLNEAGIPSKTGCKWHPLTIRRMLSNPAYCGETIVGKYAGSKKGKLVIQPKETWQTLPDVTPAIITRELFDKVQMIREQSFARFTAKPKLSYFLTGHIYCGTCGARVHGAHLSGKKGQYRYYHCRATMPTSTTLANCKEGYIKADLVETVVWENIVKTIKSPEILISKFKAKIAAQASGEVNPLDDNITKLQASIKSYSHQIKSLVNALRNTEETNSTKVHDAILDELNRIDKEQTTDERELNPLLRQKAEAQKWASATIQLDEACERIKGNIDNCTLDDKRLVLDALDIHVTATRNRIKIEGHLPVVSVSLVSPDKNSAFTTIERTSAL